MAKEDKIQAIIDSYAKKIQTLTMAKIAADNELIAKEQELQSKLIEVNEYFDAVDKIAELTVIVDKGEPV